MLRYYPTARPSKEDAILSNELKAVQHLRSAIEALNDSPDASDEYEKAHGLIEEAINVLLKTVATTITAKAEVFPC